MTPRCEHPGCHDRARGPDKPPRWCRDHHPKRCRGYCTHGGRCRSLARDGWCASHVHQRVSDDPPTQTWSVYVARCSDGTLYTGVSTDIDRRIRQHNSGHGAKYTRSRRPVRVVASWGPYWKSTALKLEYAIKQRDRRGKLALFALPPSGLVDALLYL